MKTFIAYPHTGQNLDDLQTILGGVRDALQDSNIDFYCTLFNQNDFDERELKAHEIMQHAFEIIDTSDFLLVVQLSESRSEGMLMEVGYCIAKGIPVVVAVKEAITNTYLPAMAATAIRWRDADDLKSKVAQLDFNALSK